MHGLNAFSTDSPNLRTLSCQTSQHGPDIWFYPDHIKDDLNDADLPKELVNEILSCAWEYSRCVIPQFTNWARYIAFTRIIVIGTVTEFRGALVDVTSGDDILGYDLQELLDILFKGHPAYDDVSREYRAFLLITGEKSSQRCESDLFHRYVEALARSPKDWFRLRDCDALCRFTVAAALTCNDFDDVWFNEDQLQVIGELSDVLYDAVAFYKHRAEGETNNTFAYVDDKLRIESFRRYREVLWALDVAWAESPPHRCVLNFLRPFGGPIHMMMRRYRFIEDGLMIGKPETSEVVRQTRDNVKLWNRIDATTEDGEAARYLKVTSQSDKLMFPGLAEMLENSNKGHCNRCHYRSSYGAKTSGQFGGVELCSNCRLEWQGYVESFAARATEVFPVLYSQLSQTGVTASS